MKYPPTPLDAEKLWYASAKALACQRTCSASRSESYPPVAKSAEVRPQHLCWEVEGLTLGSPSFI
jgi:hypothetical protein